MVAKNLGYDITNLTLLAFVGIVIKLFLGGDYSNNGLTGPAGAAVWGYGLVAMSILAIMFVSFGLTSQMQKLHEMSSFDFVKALLMHSLPALLLLIILVWLIYINLTYFKRINQDKVASEYYHYSTVSTVLIVVQLIILFKYLVDELKIGSGGLSSNLELLAASASKLAMVSYITTIANLSLAGIMNIILAYFSTDG